MQAAAINQAPRVPVSFSLPTMRSALRRATRLTARERASVIDPAKAGVAALRQGVATHAQWSYVCSAVQVGLAIESLGVVRGLQGHLQAADAALDAIHTRVVSAPGGPTWGHATPLQFDELDTLATAVDLHDWQLQQLSAKEFYQAVKLTEKRIRKAGGTVTDLSQLSPAEIQRLEEATR